jgi:hypothetical protein
MLSTANDQADSPIERRGVLKYQCAWPDKKWE